MKILMVCLGNICRSPLAEGIMKEKIKTHQIAWHVGELPDPRSIKVGKQNNIDITDQRARQFRASDLSEFDLILAMDSSNYQNIIRLADTLQQENKVKLIMNFVKPGMNINVPDPYYGDNGFEQVYDMLNEACEAILSAYH